MLTREQATNVAQLWVGTPYILRGRIRGAGCDCATLLAEYLIEIGAAERERLEQIGFYSHDWFCQASEERYLVQLGRFARQTMETICRGTLEAKPGTLALFRSAGSKRYNHGAIVTHWPWGIHAVNPKVDNVELTSHRLTGFREIALFDPWLALEEAA